ncbi:hypothetical protein WA158_004241 [Blastocystis sp. Blastoise]
MKSPSEDKRKSSSNSSDISKESKKASLKRQLDSEDDLIDDSEDDFIDDSEDELVEKPKAKKTASSKQTVKRVKKESIKDDDSDDSDDIFDDSEDSILNPSQNSSNQDQISDDEDEDVAISVKHDDEDDDEDEDVFDEVEDEDSDEDTPIGTPSPKKSPKKPVKKETKTVTKKTVKKETTSKRKTPEKKTTKRTTTKKESVKSEKTVKRERVKKETNSKEVTEKTLKKLTDIQLLDRAMQSFKWWDQPALPDNQQWNRLEHRAVTFPPFYVPHGIPLLYNGKPIKLTPEEEELATYFASVDPEGLPLRDEKAAPTFKKNFFECFQRVLQKDSPIKEFEKCDFHLIREYLLKQREEKKLIPANKEEKILQQKTFGYALVDRNIQKVGGFVVEPPGLFRGRGLHPKAGTLKRRTLPEHMTINVGYEDGVPICPLKGHNWGNLVHRTDSTYIFLSSSSSFKGKADREKYEKARRLKQYIGDVRKKCLEGLMSKDPIENQKAVAVWLIDKLALRVGNEKSEDEADTVGCCSLRVEHFTFEDDYVFTLDFIGKDSMRYCNQIDLKRYGEIGKIVYTKLSLFCAKKKKEEEVFDKLTVQSLNSHLSSIMPGLSAKVFRTYNASNTLQEELPKEVEHYFLEKQEKEENERIATTTDIYINEMVRVYNNANRQVAILCNHQRSLPKGFQQSMDKMNDKLNEIQLQLKELKQMLKAVKAGKTIDLKPKDIKEEEKTRYNHMFSKQPSTSQIETRIKAYEVRLQKQETSIKNKDENKAVALNTSKLNYMDPRISVAWCKKHEIPVERIFATTLRDKFNWAMSVDSNWQF